MHEEIFPENQRNALALLKGTGLLPSFYLAGGTAVALHLGHRQSIDFDFFSEKKIDTPKLIEALNTIPDIEIDTEGPIIVQGNIAGVSFSFIEYAYPLLQQTIDGPSELSVADLMDLGCMKVIAISQRGSRKDFIDLYYLLKDKLRLYDILETIPLKFRKVKIDPIHLLRSLTYFVDAEKQPMPYMLKTFDWEACKRILTNHAIAVTQKLCDMR